MSISRTRLLALLLLSWLSFLAVDLLFHAGFLADWYERDSPALLSLEDAFRRIPLGYLSFLLEVAFFLWLAVRLKVRGVVRGVGLGVVVGLVLGIDRLLGMASITTIDPALLGWWAAAQTAEMGAVGAVVGCGLEGQKLRRIVVAVLALVVASIVLAVVLQNL